MSGKSEYCWSNTFFPCYVGVVDADFIEGGLFEDVAMAPPPEVSRIESQPEDVTMSNNEGAGALPIPGTHSYEQVLCLFTVVYR